MIMPMVNVTSQGGRYDDDAYCAGWEMGQLDAVLGFVRPPSAGQMVHASNVEQLDLIAMRHGYVLNVEPFDATWSNATLIRSSEAVG